MQMTETRVIVDIRSLMLRIPTISDVMSYVPNTVVEWMIGLVATSVDPHDELTDTFYESISTYAPVNMRVSRRTISDVIEIISDSLSSRIFENCFVTEIEPVHPGIVSLTTERLYPDH